MVGVSLWAQRYRLDNAMAVSQPFCVALTGGIGSGKTTVARFFAELGVTVIDADHIARELTAPGAPGFTAIVAHFGAGILTASGELDRKEIRRIIFNDPQEKIWLERSLHPLILEVMRERINHISSPYCILVIPLLAETQEPIDFIDRVCVVDAPESLRKQWAAERDQVPLAEIGAIMAKQYSREQRLALADDVITNNSDLAALRAQVQQLHQYYLQIIQA